MPRAAEATCDYYLEQTAQDGIPYWDTGTPQLAKLGDWLNEPSDPFNDYDPVGGSAAAITAQGLWRLGRFLEMRGGNPEKARRYRQAAITIAHTLFDEPYLSSDPAHQGLILHSVCYGPKGWDYVPSGRRISCGGLWCGVLPYA